MIRSIHHLLNSCNRLLEVLRSLMILSILVLYVSNVIVANAKRLVVVAPLHYACGLGEIHYCLRVRFQKEVIHFESAGFEQFLKEFL